MGAELSHHLGYPPGSDKPEDASNHRNGTSGKTVLTDTGSLRMQHFQDVHWVFPLDVEDEVRKLVQRPQAQPGDAELGRVAQRPGCRETADMAVSLFERSDEPGSEGGGAFLQVVAHRRVDVACCRLADGDTFGLHRPAGLRMRSRT